MSRFGPKSADVHDFNGIPSACIDLGQNQWIFTISGPNPRSPSRAPIPDPNNHFLFHTHVPPAGRTAGEGGWGWPTPASNSGRTLELMNSFLIHQKSERGAPGRAYDITPLPPLAGLYHPGHAQAKSALFPPTKRQFCPFHLLWRIGCPSGTLRNPVLLHTYTKFRASS